MAHAINRLTARKVQALITPGRHADGGGLYLVVDNSGAKRWVMLYRFGGRRREMGLGSVLAVPLIKARELAGEARGKIAAGTDPIESKTPQGPEAVVTFATVAEGYMADYEKTWRNAVHRRQWRQTLEVQAAEIWSMPVASVTTEHVLKALRSIWHEKPETARRLRGRIERILDAARVGGHRQGENPARWRGHLDVLLPTVGKLQRGHHPSMPYAELPAFYATMAANLAGSAVALRFLILTAARAGEVRGMLWGEVDFVEALWTIPAERMKAKRLHRVPLCRSAIDILRSVQSPVVDPAALVFPAVSGKPLSDMVFNMLLRRFGHEDCSTHGFRTTFRDWVDNETEFAGDIAEAALAHLTGSQVERAYRRGDALMKRRGLMNAWEAFVVCLQPPSQEPKPTPRAG